MVSDEGIVTAVDKLELSEQVQFVIFIYLFNYLISLRSS